MNYGKAFENSFKTNWKKCFPNTFILRLPDQMNGYYNSSNIADFLAVNHGILYLLECKETKEGTLHFSKLSQYDKMLSCANLEDTFPIVIIWFSSFDKIIACPIQEAEKMKKDGKKSISLKMLEDKTYNIIEIPVIKKRIFLEADYTYLYKRIKEDYIDEWEDRTSK